ncbi:unnamed protein product [Aphanomyces euteiches]
MATTSSATTTYGSLPSSPKLQNHPLDSASWISRLLYLWIDPFMALGNTRQLSPSDIWPLANEFDSGVLIAAFEPHFIQSKSLLRSAWALFGSQFIVIGGFEMVSILCSFGGPIVLEMVVSAIETHSSSSSWMTLGIAVCILFLFQLAQALFQLQADQRMQLVGVKLCSSFQMLIYRKSMRLNPLGRHLKGPGDISNLFSTDVPAILAASLVVNQMYIVPFQVVLLLFLLWRVLEIAMVAGILVIFASFYINKLLATYDGHADRLVMEKKDTRMKVVHAVFSSMQLVKLQAWEERYFATLQQLREDELQSLWNAARIHIAMVGMNYAAPALLTTISFATYVLVLGKSLTAAKIFASLALFNMIKAPMMRLPSMLATCMRAFVSLDRIQNFLGLPELQPLVSQVDITVGDKNDLVIQILDGSFGWQRHAPPLFEHLNLSISKGELVVVHGSVGVGKTSLCQVLLYELEPFRGSVHVHGRVAYVGQLPWLQNLTIRDNILFDLPFDSNWYNQVVQACTLGSDLAFFSAGDQTEIGSKGVTLSGGQKARVSLARACYSDADIYILDAPFAAVDAIVQNEIWTKCILGLLQHKTIFLVTHHHDMINLPFVDRTIEIKHGQLIETNAKGHGKRPRRQEMEHLIAEMSIAQQSTSILPPTSLHWDQTVSGQLVIPEERPVGRVSLEIFAAYFKALGGWWFVVVLLVILCLWQGLQVASVLWLSNWTNANMTTSNPAKLQADAQFHLGVYALLTLGSAVAVLFRVLIVYRAGFRASKAMYIDLIQALLHAPLRFFDSTPVGRILNRLGGDMSQVDSLLPLDMGYFCATSFILLFSIWAIVVSIKFMAIVLLPLAAIYFKVGAMYIQPARECERLVKVGKSPLRSTMTEAIEGALVVRAFGSLQLGRFDRRFQFHVNLTNEATCCQAFVTQWFACRIQIISATLVLVTGLSLVYLQDRLSAGVVGLVFSYSLQITSQLEGMISVWSELETEMVAPERIAEYTHEIDQEAPRTIAGATSSSWPQTGSIQFADVSFCYKLNGPLALQDISFTVEPGEKIGIVGCTGAGKSSLTMALFRINELTSGRIVLDGVDIAAIGLKTLRESIAIIPQSPILFKGTLRQYLDPLDESTDASLWKVLQSVQLASRIDHLETIVEENGTNFSVGQRQMLCMARALLRRSRIVVMDEATAAMDHSTDQILQHVIRLAFVNATALTIAHRLDTVLDSDRILVLDQGQLVQNDPPTALIQAQSGVFFDLYREGGYGKADMRPNETNQIPL